MFDSFSSVVIEISDDQIKKALKMRKKLKKKKLNISYIDSIGYYLSKEIGIKILNGDQEFKNLPKVEFVK